MTSISQSEGGCQPTEKQVTKTLFQVKEHSRDSSNANQEEPVTTFTPIEDQPVTLSSHLPFQTTKLHPHSHRNGALSQHLSLYFLNSNYTPSASRTGIDDDEVIKKLAHNFNNSILFTCRRLYHEALPVFYASQTFHYSSTTGGLSRIDIRKPEKPWFNDPRVRQGTMPFSATNCTSWCT